MSIEPAAVAMIGSAVGVLGREVMKGAASEAGKASWTAIKRLFNWASEPVPAEIADKAAAALTASPDLAEKVLQLLKGDSEGAAAQLVGDIKAINSKVVVAHTIVTDRFEM